MKKLFSVTLSLLTLFAQVTPVMAKSMTPTSYAKALVNHTLSQENLGTLLKQPMKFQWQVARQVFILDGKSLKQAEVLVQSWKNEIESSTKTDMVAFIGSCDQSVEYKTAVRDAVFAYMTTSFASSRGTEYLYYFRPWWTVDPNNIRWGATDPRVQWAIWFRTSASGVAGHNLCSNPFTLQLGNGTIDGAGGQYWVMVNLYVHHL